MPRRKRYEDDDEYDENAVLSDEDDVFNVVDGIVQEVPRWRRRRRRRGGRSSRRRKKAAHHRAAGGVGPMAHFKLLSSIQRGASTPLNMLPPNPEGITGPEVFKEMIARLDLLAKNCLADLNDIWDITNAKIAVQTLEIDDITRVESLETPDLRTRAQHQRPLATGRFFGTPHTDCGSLTEEIAETLKTVRALFANPSMVDEVLRMDSRRNPESHPKAAQDSVAAEAIEGIDKWGKVQDDILMKALEEHGIWAIPDIYAHYFHAFPPHMVVWRSRFLLRCAVLGPDCEHPERPEFFMANLPTQLRDPTLSRQQFEVLSDAETLLSPFLRRCDVPPEVVAREMKRLRRVADTFKVDEELETLYKRWSRKNRRTPLDAPVDYSVDMLRCNGNEGSPYSVKAPGFGYSRMLRFAEHDPERVFRHLDDLKEPSESDEVVELPEGCIDPPVGSMPELAFALTRFQDRLMWEKYRRDQWVPNPHWTSLRRRVDDLRILEETDTDIYEEYIDFFGRPDILAARDQLESHAFSGVKRSRKQAKAAALRRPTLEQLGIRPDTLKSHEKVVVAHLGGFDVRAAQNEDPAESRNRPVRNRGDGTRIDQLEMDEMDGWVEFFSDDDSDYEEEGEEGEEEGSAPAAAAAAATPPPRRTSARMRSGPIVDADDDAVMGE